MPAFARVIDEAIDAGDVAAVLLRLEPDDERALISRARALGAIVQRRDIALLLDGHVEIATRAGMDGAHLTGVAALTPALGKLKPDRIAGVGGLRSRHDAMLAAEYGADYVLFGEPSPYPHAREGGERGGRPRFAALEERLAWWAELFELPCVGYAASLDEVVPLAQRGADFIALGDWIWMRQGQLDGPAEVIAAATRRLAAAAGQS